MSRSNFDIIRGLMIGDNSLDAWICQTETEEKRDITPEEENEYVKSIVNDCKVRMQDLSCSITEAYNDIMH